MRPAGSCSLPTAAGTSSLSWREPWLPPSTSSAARGLLEKQAAATGMANSSSRTGTPVVQVRQRSPAPASTNATQAPSAKRDNARLARPDRRWARAARRDRRRGARRAPAPPTHSRRCRARRRVAATSRDRAPATSTRAASHPRAPCRPTRGRAPAWRAGRGTGSRARERASPRSRAGCRRRWRARRACSAPTPPPAPGTRARPSRRRRAARAGLRRAGPRWSSSTQPCCETLSTSPLATRAVTSALPP